MSSQADGQTKQGLDASSNDKPPRKRGLMRLIYALNYSANGLWFAVRSETAFQQEVIVCGVLSVVAVWLPVSPLYKLVLLSSHFAVMVVELLNTAIECVVDKASPEFSLLAKRAKDLGSAAVLLALIYLGICWATVLFSLWG